MNVARFDFSWGSQAYHTKTLENLREAMKQTKIMCATMLDTRGPEIGVELAPQDVSSFDPQAPKKPVVLEQGSRRHPHHGHQRHRELRVSPREQS